MALGEVHEPKIAVREEDSIDRGVHLGEVVFKLDELGVELEHVLQVHLFGNSVRETTY